MDELAFMSISDADIQYMINKTKAFIASYPLDPALYYAYERLR